MSGQPASLKSQGVRSEQSWEQVPKRWMVGPECPAARLKSKDDPWSGSQKLSTRAKWRNSRRLRRSVATNRLTRYPVVRDSMTLSLADAIFESRKCFSARQSTLLFGEHKGQRLIIGLDHHAQGLPLVEAVLGHGETHHNRALRLSAGRDFGLGRYCR